MAAVSELRSLEEVQYKSKVKIVFLVLLALLTFTFAFINSFPIGEKIKSQIRTHLRATGCNPDFSDIQLEWLLPKIVVTDLTLPASCLGRQGAPLKFNFVKLNWHVINFSPIGIPFRLDTEIKGQPLSLYYVFGINQQLIRLKDQKLVLSRLEQLLGKFRLAGSMTVDLSLLLSKDLVKELSFKAASKDFVVPSQDVEGITLPPLRLNDLYVEASSEAHPRVNIEKLIVGDVNSPIRANFKGRVELVRGNMALSPLNLAGEVAFSKTFVDSIPLVDMMFQTFTKKDGFYQIKLSGTLGAPKPMAQ